MNLFRCRAGLALNYDKMIPLDAEDLAECGIKRAYDGLREQLRRYVAWPAPVEEMIDNGVPSYRVRCGGVEYAIYEPGLADDEGQSWARATYALFRFVNDQLEQSDYRLYAINGGNELGGMFLTKAECDAARRGLPRKRDWPYLPTAEHPWYGNPH